MLRWGRLEVTGGFLLLMAWINYCDTQRLLPLGICAAAAHEAGHWIAICAHGGRVRRLRLSAVGAQMVLVGALSYPAELCCALAGPAVNILLGYGAANMGWYVFAGMNLALGIFNLLPFSALDGGRAVRCLWSMVGDPALVDPVQAWLDGVMALGLSALGGCVLGEGGGVTLAVVSGWFLTLTGKKWAEKWRKVLVKQGKNR